ncbi:MAG: adenine deaminase C-terminal domain-containing protein [Geminicoccaceae bacterium]
MEPFDLDEPELRDRAVAAARGDAPFDLLVRGAVIADVVTGEMRAADIGICGPLIASVHPPASRDDALQVVDADGLVATPGLIDSHMHVESSMVTPETYEAAVLPRGVTTIVWDPHEFGNVAGLAGIDYALDCADRALLRILPLVPSCVPSAPGYETAGADFDADVIDALLQRDGLAGLAEVMDMSAVIARTPRMRGILQAGLRSGKPVCGHARSLEGRDLQAYVASGISSDHEITSSDDFLEKLRSGLTVELRSSHPYLLPDCAAVLQELPSMPPTVTFCSDDVFPDDLLASGGVDQMLRLMIGHGLAPLRALQAATLNAALRLGRPDLGLIAPGRRADIVLVRDLAGFEAVTVLRNGQPVRRDPRSSTVPDALRATCRLEPLTAENFSIGAQGPAARIATVAKPRFTRWGERRLAVDQGKVTPTADLTMIAVVNRYGRADTSPRVGFLEQWGIWRGAFATTVSHDCHNLTVFGSNGSDMAMAANAVISWGGGMAVARHGQLRAVLPLPVAGLVSDRPLEEVARAFAAVRDAMGEVVDWEPPYLTFKALVGATLACNAGPHQTDLGIADPQGERLLVSPVLADGLE